MNPNNTNPEINPSSSDAPLVPDLEQPLSDAPVEPLSAAVEPDEKFAQDSVQDILAKGSDSLVSSEPEDVLLTETDPVIAAAVEELETKDTDVTGVATAAPGTEPATPSSENAPKTPKHSNKKLLIGVLIGLAAVLVLAGSAAAYYVTGVVPNKPAMTVFVELQSLLTGQTMSEGQAQVYLELLEGTLE